MATALITGGSSGIGAEFARQLAARGYDLVLVARDAPRLTVTADRLHTASGIRGERVTVETMAEDLADPAAVARVAERIEDADRPIDLLVNCAGFGIRAPLTAPDSAPHDAGFAVMCRAILVLSSAAGRSMAGRGGSIITISSLQSFLATGSYGAIKAWVTAFGQSLAIELRGTGVTVTTVLPGWVRTEWHERAGVHRSSLPSWLWIQPDVVARVALRDAARGRVISIPTVRYRVLAWFARHLPMGVIRAVSARISAGRIQPSPSDRPVGSESPAIPSPSSASETTRADRLP